MTSDARDRLARHLFAEAAGPNWAKEMLKGWDADEVDKTPWLAKADTYIKILEGDS